MSGLDNTCGEPAKLNTGAGASDRAALGEAVAQGLAKLGRAIAPVEVGAIVCVVLCDVHDVVARVSVDVAGVEFLRDDPTGNTRGE